MSRAVRRRFGALALAAILLLAGCGDGPGSDAEADASATTTSAAPLPDPAGPGCQAAGDLAALADLDLIDAASAIPTAQTFAAYLADDADREHKYRSLDGVTAFVPVDSAWTKLDESVVATLDGAEGQRRMLQYALVPQVVAPDDLASVGGDGLPTFRAPDVFLGVAQQGDAVVLGGSSKILCSAIPFGGGLIYLTDTVLMPPSD